MRNVTVALLTGLAIVLVGCAPAGETPPDGAEPTVEPTDDLTEGTEDEGGADGEPLGGAYTRADIGTGIAVVEDEIYELAQGRCTLSVEGGASVVDDPYADGVDLDLAVQTASASDQQLSWESQDNRRFTITGDVAAEGEYSNIVISASYTQGEDADFALVQFVTPSVGGENPPPAASVVCEILKP